MKALKAEQMRALDRRTIQEGIASGTELMERAGALAAEEIISFLPALCNIPGGGEEGRGGFFGTSFRNGRSAWNAESASGRRRRIVILAGKGNNGGDAFAAARRLHESGVRERFGLEISLFCVCGEEELSGDALEMFRKLPPEVRESMSRSFSEADAASALLIVDGLLGTGIRGSLREPFKSWIGIVNHAERPTVALDIASGLNADDGSVADEAVTADVTLTMAFPKQGFFQGEGIRKTGRVRVLDIGIPQSFADGYVGCPEVQTLPEIRPFFRREAFDTYKNLRGHLLVAGGSSLYPSAPFLSAEAALRSGAGLVTVLLPASAEIFCRVPKSVIVRRLPDDGTGCFTESSIPGIRSLLEKMNAVSIGPGMGCSPRTLPFLKEILGVRKPTVMDADALNLFAQYADEVSSLIGENCVLTPHDGELRRLLSALEPGLAFACASSGDLSPAIPAVEKALALARRTGAVTVMKGPRSVIARPAGEFKINLSGCPALGTAGSGDVLTGMAGALLANGLPPFDAARAAVFLHASASEAAMPFGSRGLLADDLVSFLPGALKMISEVA